MTGPLVAAIAAIAFLVWSGLHLLPPDPAAVTGLDEWGNAATAASRFASEQLASLWGEGLLLPGRAPWEGGVQVAWAMLFDLGFIACWGYLLARVVTRAFAWEVADRSASLPLHPLWRWLGLAPLVAVAGDIGEDLLTLLAMAMQDMGAFNAARLTLWLVGAAALLKFGGLLSCLPWLLLRYGFAFSQQPERVDSGLGERPVPKLASATADTQAAGPGAAETFDARPPAVPKMSDRASTLLALAVGITLLIAVWLFARLTVCWGHHGWIAAVVCRGHYLVAALLTWGMYLVWVQRQHIKQAELRWRSVPRVLPSVLLMLASLVACGWLLLGSPIRF